MHGNQDSDLYRVRGSYRRRTPLSVRTMVDHGGNAMGNSDSESGWLTSLGCIDGGCGEQ